MSSFIFFGTFIDDVLNRMFDIVGGIFNVVWSMLCSLIYGLIIIMFNLFNHIAEIDLLSTDQISGIYQRLTMIITIVMVFYITFEFVKYVVKPDSITDKEKGVGNIMVRIIVSILLIAFIPNIFKIGYELQGRILNTNVIPKVIFGKEDFDYKSEGSNLAGNIFAAFYRVNYSDCKKNNTCNDKKYKDAQEKVDSVIEKFKEDKGILALGQANLIELTDLDNTIQFDGLLAVIFGCFMLYVLFSYNLDIATRYIQLIYLQIIAPVAAISNIAPQKDGMLKKWTKQCITTYLDIFIRLAILYFMILIMSIFSESFDFYEMSKNGEQINIFLYIMIIAGLLIFVQRAPKLLKELLPSTEGAASIGFGFNAKDRTDQLKKSLDTIKKPIAATAGAVAGVARTRAAIKAGKLTSNIKGNSFKDKLKRGLTQGHSALKAGYKGAAAGAKNGRFSEATAAARRSVQKDESLVNNGGTILGHDFRGGHYQNEKAKLDLEIKNIEDAVKIKGLVTTEADEVKAVKQAKAAWESAKNGGADAVTIENLRKEYKNLQNAIINGELKTDSQGNSYIEQKKGNTIVKVNLKDSEDIVRYNAAKEESENRLNPILKVIAKAPNMDIEIPIKSYDSAGNEVTNNKKLSKMTNEDIKLNLGAIETYLNNETRRIKESDNYQLAENNASEDKK